ncbi:MAG: hypothetical protein AB3N28_04605, partial [Kordiimonas sp.]
SERVEVLEQEKAAIEQNYQLLKDRYAELQDDLTAHNNPESANDNSLHTDNAKLREALSGMEQEKAKLKLELDKTIAELEAMLETA